MKSIDCVNLIHFPVFKHRRKSVRKYMKRSNSKDKYIMKEKNTKDVHSPPNITITSDEHTFINMKALVDGDQLYKEKQNNHPVLTKQANSIDELQQTALYIQDRLFILSAVIGDIKPIQNKYKGYIGLSVWIVNLIIHFSFDFYEAKVVFHDSWATSIGVYLVMFVTATIFIIKHTVRWYAKAIKKLAKEDIYQTTLCKLKFIFKFSPYVMAVCSVTGAAAQYGCYAYDDALTIKFNMDANGTSDVPISIELIANVLRFTSLSHIYYMMFLMLNLNVVVFFTVVHSQNMFNEYIGMELKAHPPAMTFQEAVNKFSARTKLLRGASENTTVVLTTLLVATSISFVVNAYNFLFMNNNAIYLWFAIAPLLWTIAPLIGGALVTSSFQQLKLIVMQSWVEIPEKYDELWNRSNPAKAPVKIPHPNWRAGLENVRRRRRLREESEKKDASENIRKPRSQSDILHVRPRTKSRILEFLNNKTRKNAIGNNVTFKKSSLENKDIKNCRKSQSVVKFGESGDRPLHVVLDVNEKQKYGSDFNCNEDLRLKDLAEIRELNDINEEAEENKNQAIPHRNKHERATEAVDLENLPNGKKVSSESMNGKSSNNKFGKIVGVAQTVNRLKKSRIKFNYEKYIKFLELTLDTIGFSLGNVTVTWDRASFFMVLLLTLVGVFAQNAFLK